MLELNLKQSGIYKIVNTINNKIYIGSAVDIKHRIAIHKSHLKRGNHSNKHLQYSFNKYGEKVFNVDVLFTCSKEDLIRLEQYHINNYTPEYNICKIAGSTLGVKMSDENRQAQSNRMKGNQLYKLVKNRYVSPKKHIAVKEKPILYQVDKNTFEILNKYNTIKECEKIHNFNRVVISSVLQGKCFTAHGFTWSWSDKYNLEDLKLKRDKYTRPLVEVVVLDLNGNFIGEFKTIVNAAKQFNISASNITYCCQEQRNQLKGHIFLYKKDYTFDKVMERIQMIGKPNLKRKKYGTGKI